MGKYERIPNKNEVDFVEYLGFEEQNLISSLVNFREEFDLFYNLDAIFQNPINKRKNVKIEEEESLIYQLYYFIHFYYYFSVSCYLRTHLSECFSSIRKAIDATLSAHKIFRIHL